MFFRAMTSISKSLPSNNITGLNLSEFNALVIYNQLDAVIRAFQAALITTVKSAALYALSVQQTSTSKIVLNGEHKQADFSI